MQGFMGQMPFLAQPAERTLCFTFSAYNYQSERGVTLFCISSLRPVPLPMLQQKNIQISNNIHDLLGMEL